MGWNYSLKPGVICQTAGSINGWASQLPILRPSRLDLRSSFSVKQICRNTTYLDLEKKHQEPGTPQAILTWSLWHWVRTMRPSSNSSAWSLGLLIPGMEYTIRVYLQSHSHSGCTPYWEWFAGNVNERRLFSLSFSRWPWPGFVASRDNQAEQRVVALWIVAPRHEVVMELMVDFRLATLLAAGWCWLTRGSKTFHVNHVKILGSSGKVRLNV